MSILSDCTNIFGNTIKDELKQKITNYFNNPTFDNWDDISTIVIDGNNWKTVWQAVIAVDSQFPKTGRNEDDAGNIVKEWERIPDPMTVARTIKKAQEWKWKKVIYKK